MKIIVKKHVLGRRPAREPYPIYSIKQINVGYGPGQLRPDGSRQPREEEKILADLNMAINGMSGQLV